jgi:hypothetical protein
MRVGQWSRARTCGIATHIVLQDGFTDPCDDFIEQDEYKDGENQAHGGGSTRSVDGACNIAPRQCFTYNSTLTYTDHPIALSNDFIYSMAILSTAYPQTERRIAHKQHGPASSELNAWDFEWMIEICSATGEHRWTPLRQRCTSYNARREGFLNRSYAWGVEEYMCMQSVAAGGGYTPPSAPPLLLRHGVESGRR